MKTSVKTKTLILAECAVMVAMATVLSLIIIYRAPRGGAVTLFSMAPIIVLSFRHGVKWGLAAAFVYSCIQLLLGLGNVAYVQTPEGIVLCILLDYLLAFTVIGLAGLAAPKNRDCTTAGIVFRIAAATVAVCALRYVMHLFSGAVVWYSITKENQWNELAMSAGMWEYSAIYNITYMLPETIITVIAAPAIAGALRLAKKIKNG